MNKTFLTIILLFIGSSVFAQTDSILQNKYWSYRDRFKKLFVKVGDDPGESLPFDAFVDSLVCGDFSGKRMDAGDIMATWGDYVAVLATEFELLNSVPGNDEQMRGVLNELYFAIKAYERLDGYAEEYFSNNQQNRDTNSFFVRDDIPLDFYQNWQETDTINFLAAHRNAGVVYDTIVIETNHIWLDSIADIKHRIAGDPYFCLKTSEPAYQGYPYLGVRTYKPWEDNSAVDLSCPDIISDTTTIVNEETTIDQWKTVNEMSQDHMLGVLMGCFYVKKYIDQDYFLQPTPQDEGFNVLTKVEQITDDIMTMLTTMVYDTTLHFEVKDSGQVIATYDIDFDSTNYIIINPETGLPVSRGWEAFIFSKGYAELAELITGNTYRKAMVAPDGVELNIPSPNVSDFRLASNLKAYFGIEDINVRFYDIDPVDTNVWNWIWDKMPEIYLFSLDIPSPTLEILDIPIYEVVPPKAEPKDWDVGLNMIMRLGAMTGAWTHEDFDSMAERQNFHWFEIMYAVLNDKTPKLSKSYYEEILGYANCSGSRKTFDLDTVRSWYYVDSQGDSILIPVYMHSPFDRSSAFSTPNRLHANFLNGDFNGLDFMLLHNLYRLGFKNSLSDQTDPDFCPCNESALKNYGASGNPLNTLDSTLARFPDYLQFGMSIPEHLTHNVWVTTNSGNLRVKGDLTVCNADLTVFPNATVHVTASATGTKKTLHIGRGATLDLRENSTLQLDSFTRLYVAPEGKLILDELTDLLVDENASIEIAGELEITEGEIYQLDSGSIGKGYFRFIKQSENEGAFITIADVVGNTNPTVINFIGSDDQDKVLEIDGQFGMLFQDEIDVNILNGKVELGENSSMFVDGDFTCDEVKFVRKDTTKEFDNAIVISGQTDVSITATRIYGGYGGILAQNYLGGNNYPLIRDITIEDCYTAVAYQGGGLNIDTFTFKDNTIGIMSYGASLSSIFKNFTMDNNDNGVSDFGTSLGITRLEYGITKNSNIAHVALGTVIRPLCADYEDNTNGFLFDGKPARLSINANEDAGVNTFIGNDLVIDGAVHSFTLDFHNGHTKFNNNPDLFQGVFHPTQAVFENGNNSPTTYEWYTSTNYWDNALANHWYDLRWYWGTGVHFVKNVDIISHRQLNSTEWTDSRNSACPDQISIGFLVGYDEGDQEIDADDQVVNTTSFIDAPMSEVFKTLNTKLYSDKDYDSTFILCKEILLHGVWDPYSRFDEYVLSRTYYQFLEAYGHIYSDDETTNLSSITSQAHEVLDTLINRDTDSVWSDITYEMQLDKSDIYRLNAEYDDAIDILEDLDSIDPDSTLTAYIDMLLCLNRAERDVDDGTYSRFAIDTVYDCGIDSVYDAVSALLVARSNPKTNSYFDLPGTSDFEPNPDEQDEDLPTLEKQDDYQIINSLGFAQGVKDLEVHFRNKHNFYWEVLNLDGRVIYSGSEFRRGEFSLSPEILDRGTYVLKIHKINRDRINIQETPYIVEKIVKF